MRMTSLLCSAILLATAGFCLVPSGYCAPGQMTKHTFSNSAGSRDYYEYVPKSVSAETPIPLIVMLHGCTQGANDYANLTGMNKLADKYGFALIYPEEPSSANGARCWNWFEPNNQARDKGELSIVVGMVAEVRKSLNINPDKIYAIGFSAGAAMASNLASCYSDIFSAVGIHSGLMYKAAISSNEAWSAMLMGSTQDPHKMGVEAAHCSGAPANPVAIVVFHGTGDRAVVVANAEQIVQQFSYTNDILDDGEENSSQNSTVISSKPGQIPNGRKYDAKFYGGNGVAMIQKVVVEGMGHAWSGSKGGGQFADPKGPDASEIMWQFFTDNALPRQK